MNKKMICADCGCVEGELHDFFPDCDMEICPVCNKQLLSCGCDTSAITQDMREPYFEKNFCCARCGKKYPQLKMVPNELWEFICGKTYDKDCILCEDCMKFIKEKRLKLKEKMK